VSGKTHLIVLAVTLFNIAFIVHLVRRRQLRAKYSILWISVGFLLIPLAASPQLLDRVSRWLGISYGPATFFLFSTAFLFVVVVHFSWELSRLEDRTRILGEHLALTRLEINRNSADSSEPPPLDLTRADEPSPADAVDHV
jgi:hypothetical protein